MKRRWIAKVVVHTLAMQWFETTPWPFKAPCVHMDRQDMFIDTVRIPKEED
jgi:hypothetical protein